MEIEHVAPSQLHDFSRDEVLEGDNDPNAPNRPKHRGGGRRAGSGHASYIINGSRIRELRMGKQMTLAELGQRSDLSKGTMSVVENKNHGIGDKSLERIAHALKVPITEISSGRLLKATAKTKTLVAKGNRLDMLRDLQRNLVSAAQIVEYLIEQQQESQDSSPST